MITIRHDHDGGTRLEGSTKGDGAYEILQPLGWTFRAWAGVHIRGTRDKFVHRSSLERYAVALRAAFPDREVTVELDNTWRPAAVRWEEREERAEDRADRLADRAGSAAARSTAARDGARRIGDGIPFGQPVLVGHHSEGRHRRDLARIESGMRKSFEEADYAESLASRSAGARDNEAAKHDPRAIMRKIETLETEGRRMRRHLEDTPTGEWADVTRLIVDRDDEEIAYLRGILAQHADTGSFVAWSRENIAKGDHVQVAGRWYRVKRVNTKTVGLDTDSWPRTAPWDDIAGRRRDGEQLDTPNGQPWPVELARKVARWSELRRSAGARDNLSYNDPGRALLDHVRWAPRLVHGLDLDAADQELDAIVKPADLAGQRDLVAAYLAVYERLATGEQLPALRASLEPDAGDAVWRFPAREPEDRRAGPSGWSSTDTQPLVGRGDLVKGYYDTGMHRRLVRTFCGPVASVSDVNHRREAGDWVTIRLADGTEKQLKTHMWLAVYPAGTWEQQPLPLTDAQPVGG